eukprot:tig00000411_g578.t1
MDAARGLVRPPPFGFFDARPSLLHQRLQSAPDGVSRRRKTLSGAAAALDPDHMYSFAERRCARRFTGTKVYASAGTPRGRGADDVGRGQRRTPAPREGELDPFEEGRRIGREEGFKEAREEGRARRDWLDNALDDTVDFIFNSAESIKRFIRISAKETLNAWRTR